MQKLILNIVEPVISLLDQMGLKEPLWRWANRAWLWLGSAVVSALIFVWNVYLWYWALVPWWAVPLFFLMNAAVFVVVALGLVWLGIKVVNAWMDTRKRVTDTVRIKEWADRIDQDCKDMADYYNSLADASELYKPPVEIDRSNWDWQRIIEKKISDKFYARYTGRILANNTLIEQIGINLPWHFRSSIGDSPRPLIAFHAHVASLLKDGYIEQARSIDDRAGFDLIQSLTR